MSVDPAWRRPPRWLAAAREALDHNHTGTAAAGVGTRVGPCVVSKESIWPGNGCSPPNTPTAICAPLGLPICRDKGNQTRIERLFLDIAGHSAQIDDETADLCQPCQGVLFDAAWYRPSRIERRDP